MHQTAQIWCGLLTNNTVEKLDCSRAEPRRNCWKACGVSFILLYADLQVNLLYLNLYTSALFIILKCLQVKQKESPNCHPTAPGGFSNRLICPLSISQQWQIIETFKIITLEGRDTRHPLCFNSATILIINIYRDLD